jgi:hypothetical protein
VQCSAVQCRAVQYSAVQCSAVQCSAVQLLRCIFSTVLPQIMNHDMIEKITFPVLNHALRAITV